MKDAATIDYESKFGDAIRNVFFDLKPKRIIETGLHHGNGSTRIITSLIKYIPIMGAQFFSIECNGASIDTAKHNLSKLSLLEHVEILHGLSIPHRMLPTSEAIEDNIKKSGNVKCDHPLEQAAVNYQKEVGAYKKDNCLGDAFAAVDYEPDFILLDSAGHLGWEEFWYVNFMLKAKCIIALDDIFHVKHSKSYKAMKENKRYRIISEDTEKFGFVIAEFNIDPEE